MMDPSVRVSRKPNLTRGVLFFIEKIIHDGRLHAAESLDRRRIGHGMTLVLRREAADGESDEKVREQS